MQLAGDLDSTSAIVDFRIIDPPRVSPKPVAPNRLLILPLVLLGGAGPGRGRGSFLVSLMLPTIHDGRTLREVTGRPVLGSVSLMSSPTVVRACPAGSLRLLRAVWPALVCDLRASASRGWPCVRRCPEDSPSEPDRTSRPAARATPQCRHRRCRPLRHVRPPARCRPRAVRRPKRC